jgi:hypothetical protein
MHTHARATALLCDAHKVLEQIVIPGLASCNALCLVGSLGPVRRSELLSVDGEEERVLFLLHLRRMSEIKVDTSTEKFR